MLPSSERSNKDSHLADVLSPISRKKTGRAYVALARAHTQKCVHLHALTLHELTDGAPPS